MPDQATVHASVARVADRGVLIRGASGSGKSSLLLALLDRDSAAMLVADDRALLAVADGRLVATVPDAIAGQMEVRGFGIVRRPHAPSAVIDLVVDFVAPGDAPRLPDADERVAVIAGIVLPRLFLHAGAPDGAVRVRAALAHLAP